MFNDCINLIKQYLRSETVTWISVYYSKQKSSKMVEADPVEDTQEKTFVQDTAILDKLKAAAVITDGEYTSFTLASK